jgi:hypothetical protein
VTASKVLDWWHGAGDWRQNAPHLTLIVDSLSASLTVGEKQVTNYAQFALLLHFSLAKTLEKQEQLHYLDNT